jgi:hypothetical protein
MPLTPTQRAAVNRAPQQQRRRLAQQFLRQVSNPRPVPRQPNRVPRNPRANQRQLQANPAVIPYNNNNATQRYVGTAIFHAVSYTTTGTDPKQHFFQEVISPANISSLASHSALFEEWRYNYIAFNYVSSVSFNQAGLVVVAPAICGAAPPTDTKTAFAHPHAAITSVHTNSKEVSLTNVHRGQWYKTNLTKFADSQPGCLQVSAFSVAKDTTYGYIAVRYSIEFRNPV